MGAVAALAAFDVRVVALVILKKVRFDPRHLEKAVIVQTVLILVDHFVKFAEFKAVELDLVLVEFFGGSLGKHGTLVSV